MSAIDWRKKVPVPRLAHSNDMVVITIDGRVVQFPSEAAARFFYEAYMELPALVDEVSTLRKEIDEGALHAAHTRVRELEAQVVALHREKAQLENRVTAEVQRRTEASRRATVLAKALVRAREGKAE